MADRDQERVPALLQELLEQLALRLGLDVGKARIEFLFVRGELRDWHHHGGPHPAGALPRLEHSERLRR